jgi:hypothetical protein
MPRIACLLALLLVMAGAAHAQDPFEGLNAHSAALTQPAPPAGGQAAPGPAAPFWGGNSYEYGRWNNSYYNRYQELSWRYERVREQIRNLRNYYSRNTYARRSIDQHLDYGNDLWKRYRKYQDTGSAWQLEAWMNEWERYLQSSGYHYGGGWNNGGWNNGYRYPDHGYYDNYNRWYYGGYNNNYYGNYYGYHDPYSNGWQLGNSIGHIVNGSRTDNDLQLIGGILGTAGSTIGIINDARRW